MIGVGHMRIKRLQREVTATLAVICALFFGATGLAASAEPVQTAEPTQAAEPEATQSAPEASPFFSAETIPDSEKNTIEISSIEDLQKLGSDEAYPADGIYVLKNDIDANGSLLKTIPNFSGMIDGNGHTISNLKIQGSGLFENLSGTVSSLSLINVTAEAEARAGVLAGTITGEAAISDIFIIGEIKPQQDTELSEAGGLAGAVEGAKSIENVSAFVTIKSDSKLAGALIGRNEAGADIYKEVIWSSDYGQNFAFGVDSPIGAGGGVKKPETTPTYLALMAGQKAEIAASEAVAGLTFKGFASSDETIFDLLETAVTKTTVSAGQQAGAASIVCIYEKVFGNGAKQEVRFITPVIVSKDLNETKPLEPIDPVFPTQLEEVKKLEPLDAVFGTQLTQNGLIIEDPSDLSGMVGEKVTVSIKVKEGALCQWQQSMDNGNTWNDIAGANAPDYTFTVSEEDNGKMFRCGVKQAE